MGQPARTPAQHRAAVEEWAASAPANDNAILAPARASASPRHSQLADALWPIMEWRQLQSTAATPPELCAENDNDDPVAPIADFDRLMEMRPTVGEIMRAYAERGLDAFVFAPTRELVRWWTGKRWLAPREQLRAPKGDPMPGRSLAHLKRVLAGTGELGGVLPTWGNPADSFHGGRIAASKAGSKTQAAIAREERLVARMWAAIRVANIQRRMDEKTRRTLDAAEKAGSFADVGRAFGHSGKTAERQGKQRVFAAADALRSLLDEAA